MRDGKLWTGTDTTAEGRNAMYDSMMSALVMAIASDYRLQVRLGIVERALSPNLRQRDYLESTVAFAEILRIEIM